ncbi:hypothetical protein BT69DRAFT_82467 [Atractiella rhizophila]|nr:hypothetical protein BT69DRAFT_82467 [Atractiella rhizophila]
MWKVRNKQVQRCYEPKIWFPLRGWKVVDTRDEGLMPYSFRLSSMDHHFELGATSEVEKEIWLAAMREAIAHATSIPLSPSATILSNLSVTNRSPQPVTASSSPSNATSNVHSNPSTQHLYDSPSSSPTVSAFPSTILTSRNRFSQTASSLMGKTPANVRATIDLRMADVFSEDLLNARALSTQSSSEPRRSSTLPSRPRTPSTGNRRQNSIGYYFGKEGSRSRRPSLIDQVSLDKDRSQTESPALFGRGRRSEPPSPLLRPTLRPAMESTPDLLDRGREHKHKMSRSLTLRRTSGSGSGTSLDLWGLRRKRTFSNPTSPESSTTNLNLKNMIIQPNPRNQSMNAMQQMSILLPSPILETNGHPSPMLEPTANPVSEDEAGTSRSSSFYGGHSSPLFTPATTDEGHALTDSLAKAANEPVDEAMLQRAKTFAVSKRPTLERSVGGEFLSFRVSTESSRGKEDVKVSFAASPVRDRDRPSSRTLRKTPPHSSLARSKSTSEKYSPSNIATYLKIPSQIVSEPKSMESPTFTVQPPTPVSNEKKEKRPSRIIQLKRMTPFKHNPS